MFIRLKIDWNTKTIKKMKESIDDDENKAIWVFF